MKTLYSSTILLFTALLLTASYGCSHQSDGQFGFLNRLGIHVNDNLMLGDSIVMNDIYCGDSNQDDNEVEGKELSAEQYHALIGPAGIDFTDVMSKWVLLGVRDVGHGNTLAAYYAGSSIGYCVDLMTYDQQGKLLDAINLRELHMLWRVNLQDPEDNNAFTLDSRVTFLGAVHDAMCDYESALKGKACGWPHYFYGQKSPDMKKVEGARYYDGINFARRIKCAVWYSFGYNDDVVPPSTAWSVYNVVNAPKTISLYQMTRHFWYQEQWDEWELFLLRQMGLRD